MASGTFTLTELGPSGNPDIAGERFVWTSDRTPARNETGGARACPRRPWTIGGQQRHVRTDYPGARTPSVQVLGPMQKDQSLVGRWDDRYNFAGYAVGEMARFEAMAFRGNRCRVQYQEQAFDCLIVDWDFPYQYREYIEYQFTILVFDRTEKFSTSDRSLASIKTPTQAIDEIDLITISLEDTQLLAPKFDLVGDIAATTDAGMDDISDARDELVASFDQQDLAAQNALDPFKKLASSFRTVRAKATALQNRFLSAKAGFDTATDKAASILEFETWTRTMKAQLRIMIGTAGLAALNLDERSSPDIGALYRAVAGESVYRISERFYGTPHAWRSIYERNNLSTTKLTGDELILIPRRGQG